MKRRHHLRTLSDGGGDALDRTRSYVADGEHARAIRFQSVTFFAANFARADKTAGAFTARIFNINALGRSLPSRIGSKIAYSWAM
jgi:hypothetical protein